ncbi:MAG: ABC transporter permease [Acidobacteriota bacterium]
MSLLHDLRFAVRLLLKDRWFTFVAALALALGIAANNAVFTFVNAILIRGIPFKDAERIMALGTRDARNRNLGVSFLDFEDWRASARTFSELTLFGRPILNVSEEGRAPERYAGAIVSANLFRLIGEQPLLGPGFTADDDRFGAPPRVVIGYGMWQTRYGGDPGMIGRTVKVDDLIATVSGVMPKGMMFPPNTEIWLPMGQATLVRGQARNLRDYSVIGRLADGVTPARAQADLASIVARLASDYPTTNRDITPRVVPYNEQQNGTQIKTVFLSLMGAVAFVLLIACSNVANLLLARAAHRSREISVRVSLGASRWRIVRQLLVESVLLAAISGAFGFILSIVGIRIFDAATQDVGKPYYMDFRLDGIVFAFFAAISLATGIIFGLAPALHVSKTNVNEVLKEGGRGMGSGGLRARRWTGVLIVVNLALTLVLLAGAGFMMRSFLAMYRLDLGVDTSRLLTMQLALPYRKYSNAAERNAFIKRVDERLAANGAFESAATTSNFPLGGGRGIQLTIEGATKPDERLPIVTLLSVGPKYFTTIGIQALRGRGLADTDGTPGQANAIINQRFAQMYFAADDPVGRRIRLTDDGPNPMGPPLPALTIIGVVPNVRQRGVQNTQDPDPDPVVYIPHGANTQQNAGITVLVRTRTDPASITSVVREEIRSLDPDLPLFNVRTMEQNLAEQRWPFRVFGTMFAVFAGIALVLSAVGLYAITAYSVTQRTQEIGVRMALGAQPKQVWWLIARRAFVQLAIGLAIGMPGALGVGRVMRSLLVRTSPSDPITLISIAVLLMAVASAACYWPARRATRLDPLVALRYE